MTTNQALPLTTQTFVAFVCFCSNEFSQKQTKVTKAEMRTIHVVEKLDSFNTTSRDHSR